MAGLPDYLCVNELRAGQLELVLPGWAPKPGIFHAVFPSRRGLIRRCGPFWTSWTAPWPRAESPRRLMPEFNSYLFHSPIVSIYGATDCFSFEGLAATPGVPYWRTTPQHAVHFAGMNTWHRIPLCRRRWHHDGVCARIRRADPAAASYAAHRHALLGPRWPPPMHALPAASAQTAQCPAALRMADLLDWSASLSSFDQVELTVITGERTTTARTTAQRAISSLMGLLIATSGCPQTAFCVPMARFHLPLANEMETAYRAASHVPAGAVFVERKGGGCRLTWTACASLSRAAPGQPGTEQTPARGRRQ